MVAHGARVETCCSLTLPASCAPRLSASAMRAASRLLTARHSDVAARLASAADSRRDRPNTSSWNSTYRQQQFDGECHLSGTTSLAV